jgi:glutathione peroxidase-family protein
MSVYDIAVKKLDSEEEVKLSEYTGKVLLVVNVATL